MPERRPHELLWKLASLALLVAAVSVLHYGTHTDRPLLHDVYRRLYYLPVGLAAVWFGLRGGLAAAAAVAAVYVPHIAMQWGGDSREVANRLLEVSVYFVFAGATGYFADRERQFRMRWKRAAERLERSYGELRNQADQILEIEGQLRRADRLSAIGQLATGMTHEIRNPLGGIKGAAEILKDEATPEEARREFLDILLRETERLDQVVEEFLGYARDQRDAGGAVAVELAELTQETLALVEAQARKVGVVVNAAVAPGLKVLGVPHQLKQVLLNLVLNGVQASPAGGTVTVSGDSAGERAVLAVEDTGPGLDAEQRERAFEPFYTTKEEGTGLGLAISQRIAEAHGGTLAVADRPEGGARLVLELPLFDREEPPGPRPGFHGRD